MLHSPTAMRAELISDPILGGEALQSEQPPTAIACKEMHGITQGLLSQWNSTQHFVRFSRQLRLLHQS